MPAVRSFPKHTSPQALQRGLVLQARSNVEANEHGLHQGTFTFSTFNENYPRLVPARGTPLDQLVCGDDLTKRVLKLFNFLGAQTSGLVRGGGSGICEFRVLCQGARFDADSSDVPGVITPASGDDPITLPFSPSSLVADTASVDIRWPQLWFPPAGMHDDIPVLRSTIEYKAIELHFEYVARDRAARPRFLKDTYELAADGVGKSIVIDNDGTVQELLIERVKTEKLVDFSLATDGDPELTTVTAAYSAGDIVEIPETTWRRRIAYIGAGSRFDQVPAGPYWHVTETATIKIDGLPSNVDGSDWPPSEP